MPRIVRRIVVVGGGIAGLTATEALRAEGYDGELVVVGAEPHPAYSRPALSKAALLEPTEMTSHRLPPAGHGAVELLGVSATSVDVDRRVVSLRDGITLPYDGLVIASGARPRRLGDSARELTVRTVEDALALREATAGQPSIVVIGAGPLAMELASGCVARGCSVTLVSDGQPLARTLGDHLADVFVSAGLAHGLKVVTTLATSVVEVGSGARVALADGSTLDAELVVSAVGDVPNTEWLASSGLLADAGLVVDGRGRVAPGIVAAGDVAAFPTGRGVRRVPLWTSAIDQAKVAAAALLHGDDAPELAFQPYFWTEGFGLSLKACGWLPVAGPPEVVEGRVDAGLLRWRHEGGSGAAVALNHRIPIPRLRRLAVG